MFLNVPLQLWMLFKCFATSAVSERNPSKIRSVLVMVSIFTWKIRPTMLRKNRAVSVQCNFKTGDWYLLDGPLGSGLHVVIQLAGKTLNWADLSVLLACKFFSFCRSFFAFCCNFLSFFFFFYPCWVIEASCSDGNGWILVSRYCLQCSSPCSSWLHCLLGCGRTNDTPLYYMLNFINFLTGNFHPTVRRWAGEPFGQNW